MESYNRELFNEELARFSHFHKRLEKAEQLLFEDKSWNVFSSKEFVAKGELPEVSFRMRMIISSYVAQLTFGFDDLLLDSFRRFEIYTAPFISEKLNTLVKGEASSFGVIRLSWLDLVEGHNDNTNGINLALHEFAHALLFDNIDNREDFHFLDTEAYLAFMQLAEEEIVHMRNNKEHFYRNYAASNIHEFFAVSVENFFERSVDMERELPNLFLGLTRLLKMNPCERIVRLTD